MSGNQLDSNQNLCDELRESLPDYVVGAATRAEAERMVAALAKCPDVADELAVYVALADALALRVEPKQPDAELKSKVLAALAEAETVETLHVLPVEQATPSEPAVPVPELRANRLPWWLLAAAVLLLVFSNVYWLLAIDEVREELALVESQQQDLVTVLASGRYHPVPLESTMEGYVLATILWNETANAGSLFSDMLEPLEDDQTYQLWLIDDTGATSAGIFDADVGAPDRVLLAFEEPAGLTAFDEVGISIEPAGGSDAPTSDPIAIFDVASS